MKIVYVPNAPSRYGDAVAVVESCRGMLLCDVAAGCCCVMLLCDAAVGCCIWDDAVGYI